MESRARHPGVILAQLRLLASAWRLALSNLLQDKLRLAMSIAGIALAVMLILFLIGLREGVFRGSAAYLANAPGSIVVMPEGVRSTASGSSRLLPPETIQEIDGFRGVGQYTPVLLTLAIPDWHGRKEAVRVIGYDAEAGGGPWNLQAGREPTADNEVVLDRVLANRHGFKVGDSFEVGGLELRVAGLSNETSSWVGTLIFARKSLVESLMLAPGSASFVLVAPDEGADAQDLLARLKGLPGTNVLPKSSVMANDKEVLAGVMDRVIFLMVGAAFIVGALVVGMIIYTATLERRSEYGVLKAIGARNGVIYSVVVWQAIFAAGFGVLGGVLLAYGAGYLVGTLRPQFLVVIQPAGIAATLGAGFVMALLGALVPARSVARLAPAEVFRR
jgi:putative ABC transport system permease protein